MWSDDRFLDMCASSDRARDAWIRQRQRSRAIVTPIGLVLACLGMWMIVRAQATGALVLFSSAIALVATQQITTEIRLLRLVGIMNSAKPT